MSNKEDKDEVVGFFGTVGVVGGTGDTGDTYIPDSVGRKSDLNEDDQTPVEQ